MVKVPSMAGTIYGMDYYTEKDAGWSAAAAAIVPALLRHFPARSVVELGCGTGATLAAFARLAGADVLGLDGPQVPRQLLRIPAERFRAADLLTLTDVGRRFEVACSLEFAEHLPPARAEGFVDLLVRAAPVVLFSAAIPGQGGLGHVNEQRQSWWAAQFARHGYVPVDCIRPALVAVDDAPWYYAQNALVYCLPDRVPAGLQPVTVPLYLDLVYDHIYRALLGPPDSMSGCIAALRRDGRALARAVARRVGVGPPKRRDGGAPARPT
jgi:SAM-dependent methyltransferase